MSRAKAHGLMYHDVAGGGASGRADAPASHYTLTWEQFVEHLDRIEALVPAPPALVHDLPAGERRSPSWSLTFDDGGASAVDVGEELERRGWRAYFFITTGCIGTPGFVDPDAVRALDRMGHAIGSHSVTHPARIASRAPAELLYEWQASVETLADLVGKVIRTGSIPGGHYGRNVVAAAAQAGIDTLFTSEPVRTAREEGGCLVIGRYMILEDTTAEEAARAAAGATAPWARQYVAWNLRKPVKALAGKQYARIREARLTSRSRPPAPQ